MNNSKLACEWSCEKLVEGKERAYLWTFTLKGVATYERVSRCWKAFQDILKREEICFPCVRVFEPHPGGHGFHVHFLTVDWLDVNRVRSMSYRAGFGRIHVKTIPPAAVLYIAKYLSKARRFEYCKGKRLWGCCMFEGVKVKEIRTEGDFSDAVRGCFNRLRRFNVSKTDKQLRFMAFLITCAEFSGGWPAILKHESEGNLNAFERAALWRMGAPLLVGAAS